MGLSIVAVFMTAGSMSTSRIVAAQADGSRVDIVGWTRPRRAGTRSCCCRASSSTASRRSARPTGRRSTCPRRSRELVGGFHTEYSLAEVRAVLPRRVHQHDHRLGAGRDAVPRWLAGAAAVLRCGIDWTSDGWLPLIWSCSRSSRVLFRVRLAARTLPRMRYDQFMGAAGRAWSRSAWSGSCSSPAAGYPGSEVDGGARSLVVAGGMIAVLLIVLLSPTTRKRRCAGTSTRPTDSVAARPCRQLPAAAAGPAVPARARGAKQGVAERHPARWSGRTRRRRAGQQIINQLGGGGADVARVLRYFGRKGFGVTFAHMFQQGRHDRCPFEHPGGGAALPRAHIA